MTFIVPAVLGGLAISVMALVSLAAARKGKHPAQPQLPSVQPRILIHAINDDRCTGCDACVAVCPTNVLDLVENKSRVLRFQDCIQCEACMWACPTEALVMHLEGTQPPPLKVPEVDEYFQTAIPGQYLIGEVAGKPLVKNAANLGRGVVEHMLRMGLRSMGNSDGYTIDVAIVGSGPGGLSAALTCMHHGLTYVVLEKEQIIASTVARYPKGKLVMAEPYDVRNLSFLPVFDSSKEQIVPLWEQIIQRTKLEVKLGEAVEAVAPVGDGTFEIRTTVAGYRAQRVVLATGTRGKPRTLGVPGENLPKINSLLDDPDEFRDQPVIVVGGGDSAVEAAVALADSGAHVILSYRGRAFNRAQPKNKQAVESYAAQRRIKIKYQSQVVQFTDDSVVIQMADGQQKRYPNMAAFVLIGSDPPIKWLEKLGIHFVERPHSHEMGRTDQIVTSLLGDDVIDCPEDAESAISLVLDGRLPPGMPKAEARASIGLEAQNATPSGPRKWLRSATAIFTTTKKTKEPIPLSEFARQSQRRHDGAGRRDALAPSERTRILRMLRDEGGRLADEESRIDIPVAPVPSHIEPSSEESEPYFMPTAAHAAVPPPPVHRHPPQAPSARVGPSRPQGGNAAMPLLFGGAAADRGQGTAGPSPKPALIVGLAQAKEQKKLQQKTALGRRQGRSAPPPMSLPRRTGGYGATSFDDEATRQLDSDSALAQMLRNSARDDRGLGSDDDPDATLTVDPDATRNIDLDAHPMLAGMEEPTLHVDVNDSLHPASFRPSPVAPPDAATAIASKDSFLSVDEATRAVDVSGLARLDAIHEGLGDDPVGPPPPARLPPARLPPARPAPARQPRGRVDREPSPLSPRSKLRRRRPSVHDEATRAIELDESDRKSMSDIEWDLD